MVHRQDHLLIPLEVVVTSNEFSELSLSPRSTCTALKGHESPSWEQLLHIAQVLAGVVQKNVEVTQSNNKQLEVLQQQGEALAKCKANAACLEETYKHWKADNDKRLMDWDQEEQGPERYEENEGYISDFFIPVTDDNHTIHVLTPYIKHDGLYCLGTVGVGEPIYRQELFMPHCITINKEGEYPYWFFELLHSNSTYTAMANYSQTGELQLSSNGIMTCTIILPPWSQSTGAWPLPLKCSNNSWSRASDAFSVLIPISSTNSSTSSTRVLTKTPSQKGKESSCPSLTAHAMVQLNSNQRVMSQSSLPGGKRTAEDMREVHLTPRTGRAV